jgi:hypothetical protein
MNLTEDYYAGYRSASENDLFHERSESEEELELAIFEK